MERQVLSIERMRHLTELGVDTSRASMCYRRIGKYATGEVANLPWRLYLNNGNYKEYNVEYEVVPAFTLQDILEMLPKEIITNDFHCDKVRLVVDFSSKDIGYAYSYETVGPLSYYVQFDFNYEGLMDAAYRLFCWCLENGYIK